MGMKLSSERIAVVVVLVCLLVVGLSCSRGMGEGARGLVSVGATPSVQNENGQAEVKSPLPKPVGFVSDNAGVFDEGSRERLESVLEELRDKAEIEFAVVTVETTEGQPIFDYSLAVARGWGIGPKDKSKGGGLLLLLSMKDRQWRLQVSRSLEKDLPDDETKRLGEQSKELYANGEYAEGLTKYVGAIIARLEEVRGFKLDKRLSDKR